MKKGLSLFIAACFLGLWSFSSGQEPQKPHHFYNVDTERKIKGTIQEIIMEPRYKDSSPFLIIVLEEKNTHKKFIVEISPVRFFTHDFHKGEELEVVGSFYSKEGSQNIIARQIRFRGEIIILRDKHGFPAWRGGGMKQKKRRKGRGF
ncbi:MAG: hypothetical protein GTN73_04830 [Candidatus Aminicenantes bacterium]|nr:hypothetical protein [Candidatus Aminicenantes bacterium]